MRTKAEYERATRARREHTVLVHEQRLVRLLRSRGHCVSMDHTNHTLTLGDTELPVKVGAGHVTVNGVTYPFRKRRSEAGDHLLTVFVCGFFELPAPKRSPPKPRTLREQIEGLIRGAQSGLGLSLEMDGYLHAKLDAYREVLAFMGKENV